MYFLFLTAEKKYGSSIAAVTAVFFALYPGAQIFSRYFIKDYSLLALNTAGFYLLLKSEDFSRTGISILAGIVLGAGIMFRDTMAIYMSGALLAVFTASSIDIISRKSSCKRIMNMALYFLSAAVILYYPFLNSETVSGAHSIAWFSNLYNFLLSPVFFIFFGIGVFVMVLSKKRREDYYILFWCLFPVMLFAVFFKHRQSAIYFLPVIPAAALISGAAIKKMLYFKKGAGLLIAGVIIWGIFQYFSITSYSCSSRKKETFIIRQIRRGGIYDFMLSRPVTPNLMTDVARIIRENSRKKLIFFPEHPAMGNFYWLSPLDVLMKTTRAFSRLDYQWINGQAFYSLSHIGELLRQSDILFYNGPQDIKKEAPLKEYIEMLMEQQINHAFMHPYMFFNSREDYEEIILKKNIRHLFCEKSGEEIIADFAANFRSYELLEKKEYRYPENRLYVYQKRKE